MKPHTFTFKDDGIIPNSALPLLFYKGVFLEDYVDADAMIAHFRDFGWRNAWKNGVYDYHHYHSITHEVLGIYQGRAVLQLGGERGVQLAVEAGDVIVIPAGVAHKRVSQSEDFAVVGAYPDGCEYDLMKGQAGERPKADENIARVPIPEYDPVYGKAHGLLDSWSLELVH